MWYQQILNEGPQCKTQCQVFKGYEEREKQRKRKRERRIPTGKNFLALLRKNMLIKIIIMIAAAVNIDWMFTMGQVLSKVFYSFN